MHNCSFLLVQNLIFEIFKLNTDFPLITRHSKDFESSEQIHNKIGQETKV